MPKPKFERTQVVVICGATRYQLDHEGALIMDKPNIHQPFHVCELLFI